MPLRLHAFPVSQPSRAVSWFVKANEISEVGYQVVNLLNGENQSPEFTEKTMFQAVPILELDDGSYLTESGAILNYLAARFHKHAEYPTDLVALARVHEAELHHDSLARCVTNNLIRPFLGVMLKMLTMEQALGAINESKDHTAHALTMLNTILGKKPFIAGEAFTVADYLVTCELNQLPMLGKLGIPEENKLETYPNLVAYLDRVKAHSKLYGEFLAPFEQAFSTLLPK